MPEEEHEVETPCDHDNPSSLYIWEVSLKFVFLCWSVHRLIRITFLINLRILPLDKSFYLQESLRVKLSKRIFSTIFDKRVVILLPTSSLMMRKQNDINFVRALDQNSH